MGILLGPGSEVGDFIECVVVELRGFRAADLNVSTVEF